MLTTQFLGGKNPDSFTNGGIPQEPDQTRKMKANELEMPPRVRLLGFTRISQYAKLLVRKWNLRLPLKRAVAVFLTEVKND